MKYSENYIATAADKLSTALWHLLLNHKILDAEKLVGGDYHNVIESGDQIVYDFLVRFHSREDFIEKPLRPGQAAGLAELQKGK